jgi:hypothetical protein
MSLYQALSKIIEDPYSIFLVAEKNYQIVGLAEIYVCDDQLEQLAYLIDTDIYRA